MQRDVARRLLGVAPGASEAEVERAFRRHARGSHPDHGGDPARFRELTDARRLLVRLASAPPPPVVRATPRSQTMAYVAGRQIARTRLVVRRSPARRVLLAWKSRFSSSPPRVS